MSASTTVLVIVLVLVVAAAILSAPAVRSRTRAGRLRRKYGPEYDRLAARHDGDTRAAERELAELERAHRLLHLKPLDEQSRDRYAAAWADAQAGFVDDPVAAERQAERIVGALLTAIGYPSEDAEQQLALASVDHPAGLAEYRRGYDLAHGYLSEQTTPTAGDSRAGQDAASDDSPDDGAENRHDDDGTPAAPSVDGVRPAHATTPAAADADGGPDTETEVLRQAMLHYRVFFEDLLGSPQQTVAP